ncbi:MAG: serine hydrolase, partial [Planctomycetia bacterium]|nr:serine hydrolase [Planctomycetia bacterium]
MKSLAFLVSLGLALPVFADIDATRLARIDAVVEAAIQKANCPGAVVVVVHGDAVVYRKAFGHRQLVPVKEPMTFETVFDLASLTKPIATGTSISLLIERGQLKLADPIAKHWPEFAANGKEAVTVEHCLLHTSGLIPDNSIKDYVGTREEMLARIAALKLNAPLGTRFQYSDVGFIVLGELVKRIAGNSVDTFAAENVFQPLKLSGTGYKPTNGPFAVTGIRDGKVIAGIVHDPRAYALGGVAGHAGLFGTADDLARYARMLLNGGELDGVRILAPATVKRFTEPHAVPGGLRSYGWDVDTSYSAPRGELFPRTTGFGHTGFTGTSLWIDPPTKTAIVILTNRLHPDEKKGNVTELRRQIATIVASAVTKDGERVFTERTTLSKPVLTGTDVLTRDKFALLKGKSVGLVTNHTGRASDGTPLIDLLAKAEGVKLVALFSPEHGIRGEKDEKVGDGKDEKTGLPVYSLYGERRKPTADQLKGIDMLVYDIQDI